MYGFEFFKSHARRLVCTRIMYSYMMGIWYQHARRRIAVISLHFQCLRAAMCCMVPPSSPFPGWVGWTFRLLLAHSTTLYTNPHACPDSCLS